MWEPRILKVWWKKITKFEMMWRIKRIINRKLWYLSSVVAGFLLPCINHEKLKYLKQFLSFFKFEINAIIKTAQKTALSETLDKWNLYKRKFPKFRTLTGDKKRQKVNKFFWWAHLPHTIFPIRIDPQNNAQLVNRQK